MAQNIIIGYPNYATSSATFSGGSWGTTLNNLGDIRYSLKARSTDTTTASTQFIVNVGSQQAFRLFAMAMHNCSSQATWRMTVSNDPTFATYLYQSAWVVVVPAQDSMVFEWEDPSFWSGTLPDFRAALYPKHAFFIMPTILSAQYFKIEISDTSNSAGYIELGRVFATPVWQPKYNPAFGAFSITHETATGVELSAGSVEYFDVKPLVRVAKFSLDLLSDSEVYGNVFDLDRMLGISGEAFFVPFSDNVAAWTQTSFPCRIQTLSAVDAAVYGLWKRPYELRERIG